MRRLGFRSASTGRRAVSGAAPILRVSGPKVENPEVTVTSGKWASTLNELVGSPLVYYYKPRYPEVTDEDIGKIKSQIQADLPIQGDWKETYTNRGFSDEMWASRMTLEAEFGADEGKGDAEIDPYHEYRAKLANADQQIATDYSELLAGRGSMPVPNFDWDAEYNSYIDREQVQAKRDRYDALSQVSVQWDESIFTKYQESYSRCTKARNRDHMVDHLRQVEMYTKNLMREEKFRLLFLENVYYKPDGESGAMQITDEEWDGLQKRFPQLASLGGSPLREDLSTFLAHPSNAAISMEEYWDTSDSFPIIIGGQDTGIRAMHRCNATTVDWQSWFPEYFETNELHRGNAFHFGSHAGVPVYVDAWHIDRYNELVDVYTRQRDEEQAVVDTLNAGKLPNSASPFGIFRDVPHRCYRFLADCAKTDAERALCLEIADGLDEIFNLEVAGQPVELSKRLQVDSKICKYYVMTGGCGQASAEEAADFLTFREVSNLASLGLSNQEITKLMDGFLAEVGIADKGGVQRALASSRSAQEEREEEFARVSQVGRGVTVPDSWKAVEVDHQ